MTESQMSAARLLRMYPINSICYNARRRLLEASTSPPTGDRVTTGAAFPTAPQERIIMRMESDKELSALESEIKPVEALLSRITETERQVVKARYWRGETWAETADGLGLTPSYVRGPLNLKILDKLVEIRKSFYN